MTVLVTGAGPMDEDMPLRPVAGRPAGPHAIATPTSERLCRHDRDAYGVPGVSPRFAAVLCGDPDRPNSGPGRLLATLAAEARTARARDDLGLGCIHGIEDAVRHRSRA